MDSISVREMAAKIRESDDPAMALYAMLHMLDWVAIERKVRMHYLMLPMGMSTPDACVDACAFIGLALGKIEDAAKGETDV